jgi:hypothetical protein
MSTQSIDLSAVKNMNFNGTEIKTMNLNGSEIWAGSSFPEVDGSWTLEFDSSATGYSSLLAFLATVKIIHSAPNPTQTYMMIDQADGHATSRWQNGSFKMDWTLPAGPSFFPISNPENMLYPSWMEYMNIHINNYDYAPTDAINIEPVTTLENPNVRSPPYTDASGHQAQSFRLVSTEGADVTMTQLGIFVVYGSTAVRFEASGLIPFVQAYRNSLSSHIRVYHKVL